MGRSSAAPAVQDISYVDVAILAPSPISAVSYIWTYPCWSITDPRPVAHLVLRLVQAELTAGQTSLLVLREFVLALVVVVVVVDNCVLFVSSSEFEFHY